MTIERALELLPQMRDSEWITALGKTTALYTDEAKEAFNLAISALEKQEAIKSCTPPSDDWEHYADRLHDIAYQSGYEQGKKNAEQGGWIPVTERLPEKDCSCRVTEGDFKSVFDCHWNNHKKRFEIWSAYEDDYVLVANVIAWKPKEEPYKAEEDNEG